MASLLTETTMSPLYRYRNRLKFVRTIVAESLARRKCRGEQTSVLYIRLTLVFERARVNDSNIGNIGNIGVMIDSSRQGFRDIGGKCNRTAEETDVGRGYIGQ